MSVNVKTFLCVVIMYVRLMAATVGGLSISGDTVTFDLGSDNVDIIAVSESVVEVVFNPGKIRFMPTMMLVNPIVRTSRFTVKNLNTDPVVLGTSGFTVKVTKNPFSIEFSNTQGTLFKTTSLNASGMSATIKEGYYYGVNAGVSVVNPNPHWNNPDATLYFEGAKTEVCLGWQGHAGAPYIWSTNRLGILFDSEYGFITKSGNMLTHTRDRTGGWVSDPLKSTRTSNAFFLMTGTPKELQKSLYNLVGNYPMPPLFMLGFQNSEWGITESELKATIESYRSRQIPIDLYILDFDWMSTCTDNFGDFKWNPNTFPNGANGKLNEWMKSKNVRMMGIRKPRLGDKTTHGIEAIKKGFNNNRPVHTEYMWMVGPNGTKNLCKTSVTLDFSVPGCGEWYWNAILTKDVGGMNSLETGFCGFWNDEADADWSAFNNSFNFTLMAKCQYDGYRAFYKDKQRVYTLNRAFFLGASRYAYAQWSGDIGSSLADLQKQPLLMIRSAACGSAWWAMDIGGFSARPTSEVYTKWMQMGAFVPIYRVHGTEGEQRQPWVYGPDAERACKHVINLRYTLLPHLYSAYWKLVKDGVPVTRGLIYEYPDDPNVKDEYRCWFFGDNLLYAPSLTLGTKTATFYLPEGEWIDFFDDSKIYQGKKQVSITPEADNVVLLVKKGAIIPTRPLTQYTEDKAGLTEITFHIYCGANGEYSYYEDDFISYDYEKGKYAQIDIKHSSAGPVEIVEVEKQKGTYELAARTGYFVFHRVSEKPSNVFRNNVEISQGDSLNQWKYDATKKTVIVKVNDPFSVGTISLNSGVGIKKNTFDTQSIGLKILSPELAKLISSVPVPCGSEITLVLLSANGRKIVTVLKDASSIDGQLMQIPKEISKIVSGTYFFEIYGKGFRSTGRCIVGF